MDHNLSISWRIHQPAVELLMNNGVEKNKEIPFLQTKKFIRIHQCYEGLGANGFID